MARRTSWMATTFLLLSAVWLVGCADDLATTSEVVIEAPAITTSSSAITTSPSTNKPPSSTSTTATTTTSSSTTTTTALLREPVAAGEIRMEPAGPYEDGQIVTVVADDGVRIDVYNSAPRVCATIGSDAEICSADWLAPEPVRQPAPGTQAVRVELDRVHFGPRGSSDCNDAEVECRLQWRNETGELLVGSELAFTGDLRNPLRNDSAELGDEPGVIRVDTSGFNFDTAIDILSPEQLARIESSIDSYSAFDIDELRIEWRVGSVCGFGEATRPIGSEELVDQPSWWSWGWDDSTVDFFGPVCDWTAVVGSLDDIGDDGVLEVRIQRHIYGYGGWVDCATSFCYLDIGWSWRYPEPGGGGTLGGEGESIRVAVDVPELWPSTRPSISIVEPGPYRQGQTVTVEVRDARSPDGLPGIGWCPGGDGYCGWRGVEVVDGVVRAEWTVPGTAASCGLNRCYFAISSHGEGLAPPAIVLVPIVE